MYETKIVTRTPSSRTSSQNFHNRLHLLPWPKKRTILEIRGEKNAVPSCDIMLDDARSAQGKSRGQSRMTLPCVDHASSSMISQDRTVFFSPRISGMVPFFGQGSRTLFMEMAKKRPVPVSFCMKTAECVFQIHASNMDVAMVTKDGRRRLKINFWFAN